MEKDYQGLLTLLKNKESPLKERLVASERIWKGVLSKRIQGNDVSHAYKVMVQAWKSLGTLVSDHLDKSFFMPRKKLAMNCEHISRRLPEGQIFFCYFPKIALAEGPRDKDKLVRGAIKPCAYSLIYEFHYEYPIEGIGVRKDLISVISNSDSKIPLFDWCEANDIIVYCGRCGLDITFEVAQNCPFKRLMR